MALFTVQFWRSLIFNRLWLGLLPVAAVSLVVMFLLWHYVADYSVRTALFKSGVSCLWSTFCYAIGVWSVVCRNLGIDTPEEADEEQTGTSAGTWFGFLLLGVVALLFVGWVCWPAIGYWLWDRGDWTQAVIGPVFKVLLVVAFLCPIVCNHRFEK